MTSNNKTSEVSPQPQVFTTLSVGDSHAAEPQTQEQEPDCLTPRQPCSENLSDAFAKPVPSSSASNNLWDLSIEELERGLEECEWQAIKTSLRSQSQQMRSERRARGKESLLFPTLTAGEGKTGAHVGHTACERWFRKQGIVPAGSQLSPEAIAAMHGFPTDWFSAISPPSPVPQDTQADSKPESSEEKQSPPHKRWSHSECANGSGIGSNDRTEQRHITEEEEMILSFGYTADRFYQKTVTRRNWKERHAQQFIKAWREGKPIDAYDKSPRNGGKKIATIKLTTEPYQEALRDINSWEVAYEGYPELSKDEFIDKFFPGFDTKQLLWVIRFEVVSFAKNVECRMQNVEKNNSEFFILNSTFSSALNISEIRRDGGTQSREKLDLSHVATLKEAIEDGAELDPVIVFYDGESYWLADGFHRCKASLESGLEDIQVIIHQGTRRDAVLYSVGANAEHKAVKPRSRADKRRAVMMLLNDPEWNKWSNREIARQCKVTHSFVNGLRKNLTGNVSTDKDSQLRTYTTKHGNTATMMVRSNGNGKQGSVADQEGRKGLSSPSSESSHTLPEVEPPESPPVSDYVIGFLTNLDRMSVEQRICCCDRLFDQMSDDELEEALYGIQQRLAAKLQAKNNGNGRSRSLLGK